LYLYNVYKKYFIAIVLPPRVFEEAEKIKHELYLTHSLKGALRSPAHITLHRPFEWKEEKENLLLETLNSFKFDDKNIAIELNNFAFFEPRVIYIDVLPNAILVDLHKAVKTFAKTKLGLLNEGNDLRGFHPHVTVAFRDLKKRTFYELKEEFAQKQFGASFNCSQISVLKLTSKWEVLKTFSLDSL